MFTKEELNNLAVCLNKVTISGQEATVVALLQQKIQGLLKEDGKPTIPKDK